ncbi:MAG TPA: BTAD domain-containing putative transcriptional regulator, partial [Micromonosporaceae bacterium]
MEDGLTGKPEPGAVEFQVLGPVEWRVADEAVEVGTPRQRSVLAALIVDAGRPVPVDTLIDRVWGQLPPNGARRALHVYIARLRGLISSTTFPHSEAPKLIRRSGGYLLEVRPERVDVHLFRSLTDQARDPVCPDTRRAALLKRGLDLWRGRPLSGVAGDWAERVRSGWQRLRLDAAVAWAQAELRLGNPGVVTGPLVDLAAEHPLVEPVAVALMRALYATGRSAEALDHYARIRQRLIEELGVDASVELQRVHQVILRGAPDPWTTPSSRGKTSAAASSPRRTAPDAVPAQLPLDVHGFTGRSGELGQLDATLAASGEQPTAMVIAVLSGMAGVGKTALAVHWAHQVSHRFPDGQLYVNLRGFDPDGPAMDPAEALSGFLEAFAVPPQRMPATVDAQIGLYRSLLAGRRVLVVLDNARDADQVRPLLPGAPGCVAVVTSRNLLSGLVAAQGAHPMALGLPSAAEARNLLARRVGSRRTASDEQAIDEIIVACGHLPLALAIVAARAANEPTLPLATLARELSAARGGLDAFDGEDPATDVRTVFSWSYRALSPPAARLFRLLGLHPGPEVGSASAASLAAVPVEEAHAQLTELVRANLIVEQVAGRYSCHDLLRVYATELARRFDSEVERRVARQRLLDHYLHTAYAAVVAMYPHHDPAQLAPVQPGVVPERPTDATRAETWLATERPVLMATIRLAAGAAFDAYTWRFASALAPYLDRRGHWEEWLETQHTALRAATRMADLDGQALARCGLGRTFVRLGRLDEALPHFAEALGLYRLIGDDLGQAKAHRGLARLYEQQGRFHDALDHARQTLDRYRAAGHEIGQANALNAVGWYH